MENKLLVVVVCGGYKKIKYMISVVLNLLFKIKVYKLIREEILFIDLSLFFLVFSIWL